MSQLRELIGNGRPMPVWLTQLSTRERFNAVSGNRLTNYPIDNAVGEDINVGSLVGAHSKRREQRQQIYEMVYRKCCHRIRYANDVQYVKECLFRVPEVQLWNGVPRYQINAVISYIMIRLKQKGFDVKFRKPDGVMINWERLVNGQSSLPDQNEVRFKFDEDNTTAKPLDQMATPAERLVHEACKGDCCTKPDPMKPDARSRAAQKELERIRQQEEIDRLINRRDRTRT
jgi:hypothetical protein